MSGDFQNTFAEDVERAPNQRSLHIARPLNIAFFCDAYVPTRNGVAVSVFTTAAELRKRGHRVTVFAPRYANYDDGDDDEHIVRFPAFHYPSAPDFPIAYPFLPRASFLTGMRFRRANFDIVHSHSPFVIGSTGARWAKRNGIPLIFTFHTLYHRYLHYAPLPRSWARSSVVQWVRHYCNRCDALVAPSNAVAQIASHLAPRVPCEVIPTGIDVAHFASGNRNATRQRFGFSPSTQVLLYMGRMVQEKNIVFLLRALAPLLLNRERDVHLLLAGGGPDLQELQNIAAQMGLKNRVTFTDFIEPLSTHHLYAAADIFVFASRTETQGVSIAEALAAGLPCVVVNAMGAAESVRDGETGLIVPPREEAFRRAVAQLLDDEKKRGSMAQRARETATEFSSEERVASLIALYRRFAAR